MTEETHRRSALRAVDANANRCREGLRVAEDYCRFILDNEDLAARLKSLRHVVTSADRKVDSEGAVVSARDTAGDVGTHLTVQPELERASEEEIVRSAMKRAEEALRVLEEFAKLLAPHVAPKFEGMRYSLYTIEQEVLAAFSPREAVAGARLALYVCEKETEEHGLKNTVEKALEGGVDMLVLDEPGDKSSCEVLRDARMLKKLCDKNKSPFLVTHRADIAMLSGANGVILSREDVPMADARKVLGGARMVGVEARSLSEAVNAEKAGADFVTVGPTVSPPGKDTPAEAGLALVIHAADKLSLPWFAAGEIDMNHVVEVKKAGATRIAVSRVINRADNPETIANALKALLLSDE